MNVKKVLSSLSKPIIEEFPLFVLTLIIANLGALRVLHGCIVAHYGLEAYEKVFRFFSIGTVISYLFAAITLYTRKKYVKILFYGIPIVLFIINFFLILNFGTILNPSYVLIIGETNTGEASGFLSTFLFSKNGVITIVVLMIIIAICYVAEKYKRYILNYTHKRWIGGIICLLSVPFLLNGLYNISKIVTIFNVQSLKQLDDWGGGANYRQPTRNSGCLY